jgi:hypothetical protein
VTPDKSDKALQGGNIMVENKTQEQESQVPPTGETPAGQEPAQSSEGQTQETAEQFLERTGFKTLADAEKSYKEAQKKITEQGQKLSQFEQALQGQYNTQSQPVAAPPVSGQGADFFDDPEGNVARTARNIARAEVMGAVQELEAKQSIARVRSENPAKFDALKPIMNQIYVEKPFLNNLGEMGLRQAMDEAAERRQVYLQDLKAEMFPDQQATSSTDTKQQAKNEVLAEQERNRQAHNPGGAASRPISDDLEKQRQAKVAEGDIDGLLDIKLRQ